MISKGSAFVLIGSAAVLAVAWVLVLSRPSDARPEDVGAKPPSNAVPRPDLSRAIAAPPEVDRLEVATGDAEVELLCELGAVPLADVRAYLVDSGARSSPEQAPLGATAADGVLCLPGRTASTEGKSVVLLADGCQPVGLPLPLEPGRYRVEMRWGSAIDLQVVDGAGIPQAGVAVELSRQHLAPTQLQAAASIPGADPETAIYRAVTGDDGRLSIRGLPPGVYLTGRAVPVDHVVIRCNLRPSVEVTGDPLFFEMRLGAIASAVVRITGDKVLGCYPAYDRSEVRNASHNADEIRAAKRRLEGQYPDCYVDVIAVEAADRSVTVATRFLLERCGERAIEVAYEVGDPVVASADFGADAGAAVPFELLVSVVDPQGARIDGVSLFLHTTEHPRQPIGVALQSGQPIRLPAGSYKLRSSEAWLDAELRSNRIVELEGNKSIDVSCKQAMRHVDLRVVAARGPLEKVLLRVEGAEFRLVLESARPSSIPMWLPVGDLQLTLSAPGYEEAVRAVVVEPGVATQDLLVEVR